MSSSKSAVVLGYWDIRGVSTVSTAEPLDQGDGRRGGWELGASALPEKGPSSEPGSPLRNTALPAPQEFPGRWG